MIGLRDVSLLLVLAAALAGCARETGDFGRAKPNTWNDRILTFAGDETARWGRGELVSDFNRTDREGTLRDRSWSIVRAPHAEDWFGHLLVESQRNRLLPEIDSRFAPGAYHARLRKDPYVSSEARWNRLITDMITDAELVEPFWAEARRVRNDDQSRLAAADGRHDLGAEELRDAYARIDENARVVDWVWRALRFRLAAYRMAIDRMAVETPSDRLGEARHAWRAFEAAIDRAESDFPAVTRKGDPTGGRRSRYAEGAGIRERVPQK